MFISEYFKLNRTQPALDFVDVHRRNDIPLFLDPQAIQQLPTEWGHDCVGLLQDFFQHILDLIGRGRDEKARELLAHLSEPSETHLGLSNAGTRGRAVGKGLAQSFWQAFSRSRAVRSGLLRDLEDSI